MTTVLKYSANEIIEDAFLDSGIIPPDQVPEAEDVATGFRILNRLLKLWQVNMHLWLQEEAVIFLNPGQQSYLLGPDGDEATDLDNFISTQIATPPPQELTASEGDTNIFLDSTEGMAAPPDLLTVNPIDADLWTSLDEAVISVNGDELVVTNGDNLSSSATFVMELISGINTYRVRVNNTSGEGEIVTFSVRDPGQIETGRILLSTGDNSLGQLGTNSQVSEDTFTQEVSFIETWASIAAGGQFGLVVKQDGTLWGVGNNFDGQLGLEGGSEVLKYAQESSKATDWKSVSGGLDFSVAIKTDGTLWSSGNNSMGQLGTGNFDSSMVFVQEKSGAQDWASVACGKDYALAIKTDGTLWGVGDNSIGQLGVGAVTDQVVFVEEIGLARDWASVGTGKDFTMAVDNNGKLWASGDNGRGQLGIGPTPVQLDDFTQVGTDTDWDSVACGDDFSFAIKTDKVVYSTGNNDEGQLSLHNNISQNTFQIALEEKADYKMSASGTNFSMIIKLDGTLWGTGVNTNGQLGNNTTTDADEYVQAGTDTDWEFVACGSNFSVAIKSDGKLYASGQNAKGQLGDGTNTQRLVFTQESSSATDWSTVACGSEFAIALKDGKTLYGTGENSDGQLGAGDTSNKNAYTQESGGDTDWILIDTGAFHTIAVKDATTIWGAGLNDENQLLIGDEGSKNEFTQGYLPVNDSLKSITISLSGLFSAIVKSDGTLWGAGSNLHGQLGLGTNISTSIYKQESGNDTDWASVKAGENHLMALKDDGTLWGTGLNTSGQLGVGSFTTVNTFTQESSSSTWDSVDVTDTSTLAIDDNNQLFAVGFAAGGVLSRYNDLSSINSFQHAYELADNIITSSAGDDHLMFIKEDGTLWGVGKNNSGQLGIGNTVTPQRLAIQESSKGTDWVDVRCGTEFSVALKNDGTLWGVGKRDAGQYGQLAGADISTFTQEPLEDEDWVSFDCGESHTAAIKSNTIMYTTGSNTKGQLGINSTTTSFGFVTTGTINWLRVACGSQHTIAIGTQHDLYGTGDNVNGELGDGTNTQRLEFVKESSGAKDWSGNPHSISAGLSFSVALKEDGQLFSSGLNDEGQLGLNNQNDKNTYTQEITAQDWNSIACGETFVLAVEGDPSHKLFVVGDNTAGQLGIGTIGGKRLVYSRSTISSAVNIPTAGFQFSAFSEASSSGARLFTCGQNNAGQLGDGTNIGADLFIQSAFPVVDARSVAGGSTFVVHVKTDNTLWGSGSNGQGQLGIGTSSEKTIYVQESTKALDWSMAACGSEHTMAIKNGGTLYGTGENSFGQLGSGSTAVHTTFFQEFLQLNVWTDVVCGSDHTVANTTTNRVEVTGSNFEGQLTLGPTVQTRNRFTQEIKKATNWNIIAAGGKSTFASNSPGDCFVAGDNIDGLLGTGDTASESFSFFTTFLPNPGAVQIGCGDDFSMVITSDKKMWGAGDNANGQLGIDDADSIIIAQESNRFSNWTQVSGGADFTVALNTNSEIFSTGDGSQGQLGVDITDSPIFVQESTKSTDWSFIAPGNNFSTAVKTSNFLLATGSNADGQLGIPQIEQIFVYTHVHEQMKAEQISCGSAHVMAVQSDDTVWGSGRNTSGQLGLGNNLEVNIFVQESGDDTDWDLIACGDDYSMAIKTDNKLYGTGLNNKGQLGTGITVNTNTFTQEILAASDWDTISCGGNHSVALTTGDKIFGTGLNAQGQLGLGDEVDVSTFTQESSGAVNWEEVAAGGNHTMGRKTTGAVLGTGENNEGELALNDTNNRNTFTQESSSDLDWTLLSCGSDHTIALKDNDSLWGAGDNSHGQLATGGKSVDDLYRQEASGDMDWESVSCGRDHSIAIKVNGTLWGCGRNDHGELSTGDKVNKNIFTQEQGLELDWSLSSCGSDHTMAQKDDGSLWGAGLNSTGQLGTGNTLDQIIFAREALVDNDWIGLAAGDDFTMAFKADGTLYGTGSNTSGQLGLGAGSPVSAITFTREVSGASNWGAVSAGINFSIATQDTDFFATIVSETVSTDGPVFLNFSTPDGGTELSALQASSETSVIFQITVDSNEAGDAASIDDLQLRDATAIGDHIGIRLDDGSRFWSTIDDILSSTELIITDPLPSEAATGNSVFVFDEFIDRPLRIYNGRTQTFGDDNEIPVDDWSRQEYMQQPLKSSQGIPVNQYYTPELDLGRAYIWQTANDVDQLLLFTYDKPFEVTPDTASQPDIPVEWANPLKWAIAAELIVGYGVPIDRAQIILMKAADTLKEAQDNSNSSVYDLNVTPDMR